MPTQFDSSMQYNTLSAAGFADSGDYEFRLPRWRVGAITASRTKKTQEVASFKLRLTFDAMLREEYAVWDILSDEALRNLEASLG